MGGSKDNCDAQSAVVFIVGLVAGTGCIIASKALFELEGIGITGKSEPFRPPVFQSFIMFFGMLFALPTYWIGECLRRRNARGDADALAKLAAEPEITWRTLLYLGVPALFDLGSVVMMVTGLMHINASVWMLLRGGGIVFVALMKQYALGDKLTAQMWAGVWVIAAAVCLVGCASFVDAASAPESDGEAEAGEADVAFGVAITIAGTFMQSIQYVYEEKVMSGDVAAPPWLLIGMEGLFGTALVCTVVYPVAIMLPGPDHGSYESLANTVSQLESSPLLVELSVVFCVLVFVLNSFSVLVTFMLSSVWHSILDNFRPISIWAVELFLYYGVTDGEHGEPWTNGSYLQLAGLVVMLYGTAVYNGSVGIPCLGVSPEENLLHTNSMMSSPALSRSPLVTHNKAPLSGPSIAAGASSPYAGRFPSDPMARGGGDLEQRLVGGGK